MMIDIVDIDPDDLAAVLSLNEAEVPKVGPVSSKQLQWFVDNAAYFRTVSIDGRLAAFLIGLRPGSSYGSPNYLWFCERYEDFAYVDRVAVSAEFRRQGLATRLYEDFASAMPAGVGMMTCEVNIDPPNPSSMRFHEKLGFKMVGSQRVENDSKEVGMLARPIRQR
jgi:predicted GNAT superfamily acetyltransferase